MKAAQLLQRVQELGAVLTVPAPSRLHVSAPGPLPEDLVDALREHKPEIIAALRWPTSMVGLPFPIGYGGLPVAQVEAAEALMDCWAVTDPILRKYNVLAWVLGYFQDREENHGPFYSAICAEQNRLGGILRRDRQC